MDKPRLQSEIRHIKEKPEAALIIMRKLADEVERLHNLFEQWRAEAERLTNAKPKINPDIVEPFSVDDIIEWLEHHQWTHTDWATWFEGHPDDPRIAAVGTAEFHRGVETRYSRMIAGIRKLSDNSDTPESPGDSGLKSEKPQNPNINQVSSTGGDLDDNKL